MSQKPSLDDVCGPGTEARFREILRDFREVLRDYDLASRSIEPDNDAVICPQCAHQFRAIPVNIQEALTESVKLQSHYASLLNMHDGGQRIQFANAEAWLARLARLAEMHARREPFSSASIADDQRTERDSRGGTP